MIWSPHQRRKSLHELHRRHHQVCGALGNSNAPFLAHVTLTTVLDTLDAALEVDSGQLSVDNPDEVRLSLAPSTGQP